MTSFEKIIKEYLEKRAQGDAVFAEKFIERCNKEKDAIADCCAYIMAEAKNEAVNGCAVIEDDKVFGWAMHYFDEGIAAPAKTSAERHAQVVSSNTPEKAVKTPAAKPKAKAEDDVQLSLW